jgi:hypothetical protein
MLKLHSFILFGSLGLLFRCVFCRQGPLGDTLFLDAAADAVNLEGLSRSRAEIRKLRARHNVAP